MGKAISLMAEVQLNTQGVKADLSDLEKTQTRIPLAIDAREAKRQANATLSLIERMERNTIKPIVDATSIRRARDEVTNLDKAWQSVSRSSKAASTTRTVTAQPRVGMGGMGMGLGMGSFLGGGAGAFAGVLSATAISSAVRDTFTRSVTSERMEGFMGRAYGPDTGAQIVETAKQLSEATGFVSQDFMRASLIGKTLANNYGLQTEQITKLVAVSADLAATSPYEDIQTVSNAMERLQSAVRGEAEASERLGLTLNDTYMKNIAFGGSLKGTWEKLSDLEKAQYRYQEILNQTKDVLGAAEEEGLSKNLRETQTKFQEAGKALMDDLLPPLTKLIELLASIPSGAYEAAMWGGAAIGGAMLGRGMFRFGRKALGRGGTTSIMAETAGLAAVSGGGGDSLVADIGTMLAGEAIFEGISRALRGGTAKKAGSRIAEEVTGEVSEEVLKRVSHWPSQSEALKRVSHWPSQAPGKATGGTIGTSLLSRLAGVGGGALGGALLAGGATAALGGAAIAIGLDAQRLHMEKLEAQEKSAEQRNLTQRYIQQIQHGIDWGLYEDETGVLRQGRITGWDEGARQPIYTTRNIGGKLQQYIAGYEEASTEYNRYGSRLGSAYYGEGAKIQVVIQDRTTGGVRAQDAQSYAPSTY